MTVKEFDAVVFKSDEVGASAFVEVPFSVPDTYGTKGIFRVKGTADGVEYVAAYSPYGGKHLLIVRKELMAALNKGPGDTIHFAMAPDTEPRVVTTPADLAAALAENDVANDRWEKLAYSHKKEYVQWLDEAKKRETRDRRIEKAVEMIAEGQVRKK